MPSTYQFWMMWYRLFDGLPYSDYLAVIALFVTVFSVHRVYRFWRPLY